MVSTIYREMKDLSISTKTGLRVIVNLIDKVYDKGRQVMDGFNENLPIIFDEHLPKWNYRATPPQNA